MEKSNESLPESFMHSAGNEYTGESLIDLGESLLDSASEGVFDSDILIKIPVLGVLAAFTKGILTFRDRRYATKILSFLAETSKASNDDREKYKKKLEAKPEECKKAGETILDIIDKITSEEKALMVGKVFRAFMHEDSMTFAQIIYLSEIIERTYLQDLISLQKSEIHNGLNLQSVGLRHSITHEDVNKIVKDALLSYSTQQDSAARLGRRGISAPALRSPALDEPDWTDAGLKLVRILRSY